MSRVVMPCLCSLIVSVVFGASLVSAEGQCIKGRYHKPEASPANGTLKTCTEYNNTNVCCTAEFTAELAATRTEKLYNHTWDLCKPLNKTCLDFWMHQECFYQCSPYLYKWAHPKVAEGIHGVPICSSYCDAWFNACKDDQTCVEDVLTGYEFLPNGTNRCPAKSTCVTYEKMFKNGEGLCNKMWSTSYVYTKENSDRSNCMVMHFKGDTNPNAKFFNLVNLAPLYTGSLIAHSFVFIVTLYLNGLW